MGVVCMYVCIYVYVVCMYWGHWGRMHQHWGMLVGRKYIYVKKNKKNKHIYVDWLCGHKRNYKGTR